MAETPSENTYKNETTDFHRSRFPQIQALRGLAALLVVTQHIRFLGQGAFGVDIFFCISGFMIMFTTYQDTKAFFRKRLIRILPFYYLMTIGTFLLLVCFPSLFEQTKASVPQLFKSLLFIPFDMGNGVIQPLLRIGWTVNCEMFFYLIFWISFHISHKYRGIVCSGILLALVGAGAVLTGGASFNGTASAFLADNSSSLWAPVLFYADPIMLEFALGILCYEVARWMYINLSNLKSQASVRKNFSPSAAFPASAYKEHSSAKNISAFYRNQQVPTASPISMSSDNGASSSKLPGIASLGLGLFLLLLLYITYPHVNVLGYRRVLLWGLPCFLVVLLFFHAGLYLSMPAWSVKLGDISYSIYLIHYYPVLFLDRKVFDFSTLRPASVLGVLVAFGIVLLLSYISWYLMENKFTKFLRRHFIH